MVVGDRAVADRHAQCAAGKEAGPAGNGAVGQGLRPTRLVLQHGRHGSGLAANGGGAAPRRSVGHRAQDAQRVQRLDGVAPAQPRAQHRHAGGVAAGGRQVSRRTSTRRRTARRRWAPGAKCSRSGSRRRIPHCSRRSVQTLTSRASGKSSRRAPICAWRSRRLAAFYSEMFGYPDARGARRCASHRDRASARAARAAARQSRCAEQTAKQPPKGSAASRQSKSRPKQEHTSWPTSGTPIQIKPEQAISEAAALGEKIARGTELFSKLRDDEVAHRHDAEGRGLAAGQGDAPSLPAAGREEDRRPRC